jgi:hypothetical protein
MAIHMAKILRTCLVMLEKSTPPPPHKNSVYCYISFANSRQGIHSFWDMAKGVPPPFYNCCRDYGLNLNKKPMKKKYKMEWIHVKPKVAGREGGKGPSEGDWAEQRRGRNENPVPSGGPTGYAAAYPVIRPCTYHVVEKNLGWPVAKLVSSIGDQALCAPSA